MLIHRGKLLREAVDKYCKKHGSSITRIARKAGYDQSTIYRHFDKDDLSYPVLLKYGKAMEHDFSEEFPEMAEFFSFEKPVVKSEEVRMSNEECMEQLNYYQKKYIDLLEKHNQMLTNRLTIYEKSLDESTEKNP
jgi:hypothetical protein